MRTRGIAVLLTSAVLLLAGCTGPTATPPTPSGTAGGGTGAAGSDCPTGTSLRESLCLADDAMADDLAAILHTEFDRFELGAVIAGVWHDGEPVLFGALGESITGVPATPDMHHMLGNLSTPMFATVVLQQVDAGVLALEDPLSTWFPDLPSADRITIEMLLHNISGYGQYTTQDDFLAALYQNPFRAWTPDEIAQIGTEQGTVYEPGTDFMFSDTNTAILAAVLEKATGKGMPELMQAGIYHPLGMDTTTADMTSNWSQPVLHGFDGERGMWEDTTYWNPSWATWAGGAGSNAEEIGLFLDAFASGELLSDEMHEAQFAPTTIGIGTNKEGQYWAIGALMLNGWAFLNPNIPGYIGAGGTLPGEGWTMVIYTTASQASDPNAVPATEIFRQFTEVVAPEHSLVK